jgi:hypothetical protein
MREGFGAELRSLGNYLPWNSPSTNQIRNNSMQGAVVGTPGTLPTNWSVSIANGLSTNVVGSGTLNGVDYIDVQISGTTTGVNYLLLFEATNLIAAAQNQIWTGSAFFALIAGSLANLSVSIDLDERGPGGGHLTFNVSATTIVPTATTLPRYFNTATLSIATTAFVSPGLFLGFNNGVAINFTLRIGWPQLEQGGAATPPIRTTGAAASRLYRAVHQPDLGSPPNVVSVSGFGAGGLMGAFIGNDAGQADQAQGMVKIWVGAAPAGSGTIVLRFPIAPSAGQYIALSDWATFTYGVAGNNLTINWTATRTLLPGEQLGVSYQWATST